MLVQFLQYDGICALERQFFLGPQGKIGDVECHFTENTIEVHDQ